MRKAKSELLVRGALLRDIAALKRRVQALEKAVWPSGPASPRPKSKKQSKRRLIELDEATARRVLIEAFHQAERDEWIRENPRILERRREDRERLNEYLRERGFGPEPDDAG